MYNILSRISEILIRKFILTISYTGNHLLISIRILLTVYIYILVLYPLKYIHNT